MSKKSGLVYEQRLIQKYINDNGKDPVTGDTLDLDDLIEIKSSEYGFFDYMFTQGNGARGNMKDLATMHTRWATGYKG